jgi:predicted SprT family Zn-dependent metalloprotease
MDEDYDFSPPRKYALSPTDRLRLRFHVNDSVWFRRKGEEILGTVTRLNPKLAVVISKQDEVYRVPYQRLSLLKSASPTYEGAISRSEAELEEFANWVLKRMTGFELWGWKFGFANGATRVGHCDFDYKEIMISLEHSRYGTEAELNEIILHEIAHAVMGHHHHHDEHWRDLAQMIGATGNRCQEMRYIPPRYLMKCENYCWVGSANKKGSYQCRRCQAPVLYMIYSDARFKREKAICVSPASS